MNQNHLKHLFYRFSLLVQNVGNVSTDSWLKRFAFEAFGTDSTDSSVKLKRVLLPNAPLISHHTSDNTYKFYSST
jgi:hypothetical protein